MGRTSRSNHPVAVVRRGTGKTQAQFAEILGISRGQLAKIESYVVPVSPEFARNLFLATYAIVEPGDHDRNKPKAPMCRSYELHNAAPDGEPSQLVARHVIAEWTSADRKSQKEVDIRNWAPDYLQEQVDTFSSQAGERVTVLLNAAARKGAYRQVMVALEEALRTIVSDYSLEEPIKAVLRPHDLKWNLEDDWSGREFKTELPYVEIAKKRRKRTVKKIRDRLRDNGEMVKHPPASE